MKTAREILIKNMRNEIPDGDSLSGGVIEHIECFSASLEAMEEYASQFRPTLPKLFDIDFDGCVMARIEIINNIPVVTMAMNGYGNPINRDSIRINPLPSEPEKGGEE